MSAQDPHAPSNPLLSDADIEALRDHGWTGVFQDGEPIFRAGEKAGGFFVVLRGAVEILDRSGDEPRLVARHGPRQFTGDIDIVTRRRPLVNAVASGETEVIGVASADIRRLIGERPRLGEIILGAFIARRQELLKAGYQGIRVIGSGNSRDTFRLREFLSRNRVPFTWIDVDEDEEIGQALSEFGVASSDLPVVDVGERPLVRNPSVQELSDVLGLRAPFRSRLQDLVIIGAGPAGLAAAVYGASEGLGTLVLDAVAPGGQAGASTRIENYLGFPNGISGSELTGRATLQAQKFGAELSSPSHVTRLDLAGDHPVVGLESGEEVEARCVLIATGADYRRLVVPGRESFDGMGIYYAATPVELSACRGSEVVVVGGGNSAGQAVMFLSEHTRRVWLLLRGGDLRKRMSSYLAERVETAGNVEVLSDTEVRGLVGSDRLEGVEVENTQTGETRTIRTPALFSFIGAVPRTEWLPEPIETDRFGFIRTGRGGARSAHWKLEREPYLLETTHPGVFAAGDVRAGSTPRVASAVGEGAMVVKMVHEFLAAG